MPVSVSLRLLFVPLWHNALLVRGQTMPLHIVIGLFVSFVRFPRVFVTQPALPRTAVMFLVERHGDEGATHCSFKV